MPVGLSRVPKFIAPQIPVLSAEPPEGQGWIHEIKHDGFRTLLRIDRGDIRAFAIGFNPPNGVPIWQSRGPLGSYERIT